MRRIRQGPARRRQARAQPSLAKTCPKQIAATTADTPVGRYARCDARRDHARRLRQPRRRPRARGGDRGRRGSRAARAHLADAKAVVAAYFAGRNAGDCEIDWDRIAGAETLRAAMAVPRAQRASYDALDTPGSAAERGRVLGTIRSRSSCPATASHAGVSSAAEYVGGVERRLALLELEQT